jgi:hypothetical protein
MAWPMAGEQPRAKGCNRAEPERSEDIMGHADYVSLLLLLLESQGYGATPGSLVLSRLWLQTCQLLRSVLEFPDLAWGLGRLGGGA